MTSSQLSDHSMYSRGQVLTRDFNTLRSLIVLRVVVLQLYKYTTVGTPSYSRTVQSQYEIATSLESSTVVVRVLLQS